MLSFFKKILLRCYRFPRYLLVKKNKLGDFHITTERDKKYVTAIKEYLNQRAKRDNVIEIGVGLGDILLDLEFKYLVGADKNQNVINAITFISKFKKGQKKVSFIKLNFEKEFIEGIYDVVILVNWIHTIDSEILKKN